MPLSAQEMDNRVTYHPPTGKAIDAHEIIRKEIRHLMESIEAIVPNSREQSVAITKLEEVMFWSNAGIARNHDKL